MVHEINITQSSQEGWNDYSLHDSQTWLQTFHITRRGVGSRGLAHSHTHRPPSPSRRISGRLVLVLVPGVLVL